MPVSGPDKVVHTYRVDGAWPKTCRLVKNTATPPSGNKAPGGADKKSCSGATGGFGDLALAGILVVFFWVIRRRA